MNASGTVRSSCGYCSGDRVVAFVTDSIRGARMLRKASHYRGAARIGTLRALQSEISECPSRMPFAAVQRATTFVPLEPLNKSISAFDSGAPLSQGGGQMPAQQAFGGVVEIWCRIQKRSCQDLFRSSL